MYTAAKIKMLAGTVAVGMLSYSASAVVLNPTLSFLVTASLQDSAEKQAGEDKPAQPESGKQSPAEKPAQEKRAQEESSQAKPAQEPSPSSKPDDNPQSQPAEKPSESAPAQSPNTPASGQSGSPAQEANPAAPQPPPPASEHAPANPNVSPAPKPSPTVKSNKPQNGASTSSKRRIIREGGTGDANALLAPSMTAEQASHQRENTTRLLNSADANLQKIAGRPLSPDQQATVDQIRAYMQQAKDALSRGDLQRSHNLALKANLLSDDLARH